MSIYPAINLSGGCEVSLVNDVMPKLTIPTPQPEKTAEAQVEIKGTFQLTLINKAN